MRARLSVLFLMATYMKILQLNKKELSHSDRIILIKKLKYLEILFYGEIVAVYEKYPYS